MCLRDSNADTGESFGAVVQAAVTLTVGAPKTGLLTGKAAEYVGRLEITPDVGLTACPCTSQVQWDPGTGFHWISRNPPRVPTHKGTYGHLAIMAGSLGFHGAAVLATRGAQRAQPGLITVLTPEEVYNPVASQLQAAMVTPWRGAAMVEGPWTACLAGPGLAAHGLPRTSAGCRGSTLENRRLPGGGGCERPGLGCHPEKRRKAPAAS